MYDECELCGDGKPCTCEALWVDIEDLVPAEPAEEPEVVELENPKATMKMVEPAGDEQKMVTEEGPDNRIEEKPPSHGQTAVKYAHVRAEHGHKRHKYMGRVRRY